MFCRLVHISSVYIYGDLDLSLLIECFWPPMPVAKLTLFGFYRMDQWMKAVKLRFSIVNIFLDGDFFNSCKMHFFLQFRLTLSHEQN